MLAGISTQRPDRSAPRRRPAGAALAAAAFGGLAVAAGLGACRSAAEHRASADEEVYAIVEQRRAEIGSPGMFTIEPPPDSLRRRIIAARESGEPLVIGPLTLAECLEIAAENSREYQDQREQLYLTALDLTLERWRFTIQEQGTFAALLSGHGSTVDEQRVGGNFALSRLLGTGALIVGDIGLDLVRALAEGEPWEAVSSASLTITQPLLRGFGADIVQEPLTQAERNVVYQARSYERFRRTFAFDIVEQVFRIAQQVDTLRNEEQNHESLTRIRERNEALAEAGQIIDLEVDQARQNELNAATRVVTVRAALDRLYDDFKIILGLPVETELTIRDEDLRQVFGLVVPEADFSEELAIDVALAGRFDHLTAREAAEDAERGVHVAADALRAGLDVVASASATSDSDQPLDFSDENLPWTVGLELDLPLDRLVERNVYRRALIDLERARRAYEESEDRVTADVRNALRELETAGEQLEIETNAARIAERQVENATLNQAAGRSETRDLLEAQDALVQARNAVVRAQVDVALARLALYRDMELLRVDEMGIVVDTAPLESQPEPQEGE